MAFNQVQFMKQRSNHFIFATIIIAIQFGTVLVPQIENQHISHCTCRNLQITRMLTFNTLIGS